MKATLPFAILFLLAAVLADPANAQSKPSPDSLASPPTYRNAVRLDLGGIVARNLGAALVSQRGSLPLLFGYERQLGRRTSANAELLLNGGNSGEERTAGFAVQGRYYFHQMRRLSLAGFYVAPTLGFRRVTEPYGYGPERQRQQLGGAGALLGAQIPLGNPGRLVLDASFGVMSWQRLDAREEGHYYQRYYEIHGTVADGRLSLGYRF